jgi:dihydrofolate reductase
MRKVIYMMSVSLDGFIEGPDGKFAWSFPDEEIHRFYNQETREMGAFLYGRRMYETMAGWEDLDQDPSLADYGREFSRIWKSKPKVVFSTTLPRVGENCRLVRGDVAAEVSALKKEASGDLGVGGPGLAQSLARLGLIDEYRLVVFPVMVGGGKPFFPRLDQELKLTLVETRTFGGGSVYLRYEKA